MSKIIYTTLFSLLVAISAFPTVITADIPPPTPIVRKPLTVKGAIVKYATVYAAPEKELLMVAQCESNFNPRAVGDQGRARNIFQYHKPTFIAFSKLLGEKLDYNSYEDQAKLTAFIFKHYPQYKSHWVCHTKLFGGRLK